MSTHLIGGQIAVLELKIELSADDMAFVMTIIKDRTCWRYNVSDGQHSRLVFGRVIASDHEAAMRRAAAIASEGYEPGTVERGLFDMLTAADAGLTSANTKCNHHDTLPADTIIES